MNMSADDVVKVIPRGNGDLMLLGVIAIVSLGIVAYVFVKGGEKEKDADTHVDVKKKERIVNEDVKQRNENDNTKKDNKHKGGKETKSIKHVTPVKTQHSGNAVENQQQQQQQVINTPTLSQANVQEIITNISVIKTDKPQKEPVINTNDDHTNNNNNNKANTNDVDVVNKNTVEDIITTVVPSIDIVPPELHANIVEANITVNENDQTKSKAKKTKKKKPSKKENKQQQETNLSLKPITPTEEDNNDDSGWIEVGSKKGKTAAQTKQKQIDQLYKEYLNQY